MRSTLCVFGLSSPIFALTGTKRGMLDPQLNQSTSAVADLGSLTTSMEGTSRRLQESRRRLKELTETMKTHATKSASKRRGRPQNSLLRRLAAMRFAGTSDARGGAGDELAGRPPRPRESATAQRSAPAAAGVAGSRQGESVRRRGVGGKRRAGALLLASLLRRLALKRRLHAFQRWRATACSPSLAVGGPDASSAPTPTAHSLPPSSPKHPPPLSDLTQSLRFLVLAAAHPGCSHRIRVLDRVEELTARFVGEL